MNNFFETTLKILVLTIGFIFMICSGLFMKKALATTGPSSGFYAGGSLGYLHQNTTIDAKQNPNNPNADFYSASIGRSLPHAELFFGWGKIFYGTLYGGIEGKLDYINSGKKKIAEDIDFSYHSGRKGLGLSTLVRLGYFFTSQTMLYAGMGFKMAAFKHDIFEKTDQISAPFSEKNIHALTEVGLETISSISPHLGYRVSYSYMPQRIMSRSGGRFPTNHMYYYNGKVKTGVSEHAIKMGLVYHF